MEVNEKVRKKQRIKAIIAFSVVFILIALYLWDFSAVTIKIEQEQGRKSLEELAMQGTLITRNKIDSSIAVLRTTARSLAGEEDYQSDEVMEYLQSVVDDKGTDIMKIGSVDLDGNARVTDGRRMNLKDKTFFCETVKGKEYVSSLVNNKKGKDSIAISVPVYDQTGKISGVIYGVIVTEDFQLYDESENGVDERNQYIHIIDREGNFVSKAKNAKSVIKKNNIFDEIAAMQSDVSVERVRQAVAGQETVFTSLRRGDQQRYVYFAPMNINRWSVVAVLNGDQIEESAEDLRNAVAFLILKMLITLCLFGVFYYRLLIEEKNRIIKLNEDLLIKDKTFNMAVSKTGDFVFLYDPRTNVLEFMNYNEKILDIPRVVEDFPKEFSKYVRDQKSQQEIMRILNCIENGQSEAECEIRVCKNELETVYRIRYTTVENAKNRILQVVGAMENITKEKLQEIRLKKGEQIRAAVLSDVAGFFEINLTKNEVLIEGEHVKRDYTYSEMLDRFVEIGVQEKDRERVRKTFAIENLLKMFQSGMCDSVIQYARINEAGAEYWVECEIHLEQEIETEDIIALVVIRDINEVKQKETKLKAQAMQDPLTKIYNRSSGIEKIKKLLNQKNGGCGALLLIDIDDFKSVNDTMGHSIGDLVLTDVAHTITNHVYRKDVVCRLGGDEFLVFLVDIPKETIGRNVTKLSEKLHLSYEKDGVSKTISVSVGIAVAPEHGTDFQSLYEKADIALYKVKNSTKNDFRFYE